MTPPFFVDDPTLDAILVGGLLGVATVAVIWGVIAWWYHR